MTVKTTNGTPTTASDSLDVTNPTVYPTTTADADGGIDLAAIHGLEIQHAPEPGTSACLGTGDILIAGACAGKRRKSRLPGGSTV